MRTLLAGAIAALAAVTTPAAAQGAGQARATPFTDLALVEVAGGLVSPHFLTAPQGDGRLFVIDQIGTIRVIDEDGALLDEPFLDLTDRMVVLRETYDERGLLGLAFHPGYAENGRFFVHYTAPLRDGGPEGWDHTDHVSEFSVSADDPNRADPDSERLILQIDQPQMNHNGGALAFGFDGYLYIAVGDGGDADDTGEGHPPLGNGQDVTTILGNILRIDVDVDPDGDDTYRIPDDNPFVGYELPDGHPFSGDGPREEIWAWGFRHPWRMTLDRGGDGELYVSDAGENLWEEISRVAGPGNYGWNIKEGLFWFDPANPHYVVAEGPAVGHLGEELVDPVVSYPNNRGRAQGIGLVVIGGYVYRGEAIPELQGQLVFGDWSRFFDAAVGVLMVAAPNDEGLPWTIAEVGEVESGAIQGFGEGADGELYVLVNDHHGPIGSGSVYRIVRAPED